MSLTMDDDDEEWCTFPDISDVFTPTMDAGEEWCIINKMPDSILLKVFRYIRHQQLCLALRLVCRRWHVLSHDSELWRQFEVTKDLKTESLLLLLNQINEDLEKIDCSNCTDNITEDAFDEITKITFPRLKHLAVPITGSFSDSVFQKLAEACPNLEELENVRQNLENTCNPLLCQSFFSKLKVVHDKPVSTYGRLTNSRKDDKKRLQWEADLAKLSAECPEIHTYKCSRGMEYINNDGIELVSALFPLIHTLDLWYTAVDDEGLVLFFRHNGGRLTKLILDKPGNISDIGLQALAKCAPHLTFLKLSRCLEVTDEGIAQILERCRFIKELHLHNIVITLDTSYSPKRKGNRNENGLPATDRRTFRVFNSMLVTNSGGGGSGGLCQGCNFIQGLVLYDDNVNLVNNETVQIEEDGDNVKIEQALQETLQQLRFLKS